RETGGAATFVRIAFNDLAGFLTGWALFLDYLIVIALSALFMPYYLATALHVDALSRKPWDVLVAMGAIVLVALARAFRRPAVHTFGIVVPVLDLVTQLLLVGVGFAVLFSPHALTIGTSLGTSPSWHAIAFAFPLAMLAYTGLETVANFAEEVRRPGRDLPRSLFSAVGLVVVIYVLIALVGLSAFPARGGTTALLHDRVSFLASLFSFGVLLAFTSAQLAVIRLRRTRPDLRRPFRVPLAWRGIPVPSALGALATGAVFVDAMITHRGARYGGP